MSDGKSRRDFIKKVTLGTGGVAAASVLSAVPAVAATPAKNPAQQCSERVTKELPIPDIFESDRPEKTEYSVDVLVVGGGYAGINAAYAAKKAGRDVLLIDKGRPGYSGQSPWPGTFNYFDAEMGDDPKVFREFMRYGSEYFGNLNWVDVFINESKAMYERIKSWGILDMYPRMAETPYIKTRDYYGYRDNILKDKDRRQKFVDMLDREKIPWIQHVMVNNVIVQDGKCAGAIGYQFTTGAIITVHAKSVVLATGNGAIINTGHPIGSNTYDGEFMAYQLGLPIGGKEFEDFHTHQSFASGNNWIGSDSRFFDPDFLCGGNVTMESLVHEKETCEKSITKSATSPDGLRYVDALTVSHEISPRASARAINYGKNPKEMRMGKAITPYVEFDAPGAAVGMCLHLASGVFCGMDDTEGKTGIPGLYVAGDGTHLTNPNGGNYKTGNGFTSCFCSINGDHSGKAAAAYAANATLVKVTPENIAKATEEIEQPLKLEKGFSPTWARDALLGIMAPYWVMKNKSEATLSAALTNVVYMRTHVANKLMARNGHGVRLCHEMKHRILASELKLRAALARKESRGTNFFREDYPQRNDAEYLKYVLHKKGADGAPVISFEPVKKEWTAAGIPADFKVGKDS